MYVHMYIHMHMYTCTYIITLLAEDAGPRKQEDGGCQTSHIDPSSQVPLPQLIALQGLERSKCTRVTACKG